MTALMIPEIIWGIAFTIVVIMVGSACTNEISRSIPACIICGIDASTAAMMPSII